MSAGEFRDLEAERQVLRYIAEKDASLAVFARQEWFSGEIESEIYSVLRDLQAVVPTRTLKAEILKKIPDDLYDAAIVGLEDILSAPEIENRRAVEIVAGQIRDLYWQRAIIQLADTAAGHAERAELGKAFALLRSAGYLNAESAGLESGDYLEDFEARENLIKERKLNEKNVGLVPTGITQFDAISGGLLRGEVGVVIAQTGGGKSISLMNFGAFAWLQNFNVVFLGLEMDKVENQLRMDSLLTEIPAAYFRRADLTKRDFSAWEHIIKHFRATRENYIEFVSGKGMTMADILSVVEAVEARRGRAADLFILDHIVLVNSGDDDVEDSFHMKKWRDFQKLCDWAKSRKIATWTASQTRDEGASRKEGMRTTDVKYSRAIAELAHVIVALWQSDMDIAANALNMRIIKGRGVKKGQKIMLKPDLDRMALDAPSWAQNLAAMQRAAGDLPRKTVARTVRGFGAFAPGEERDE